MALPYPQVRLGNICNIFTGKKDVNQTTSNGKYLFFSCSPKSFLSDDYLYNGEAIIVAGNGSFTGRTSFYNGRFDLYQRTYACTKKENVSNIVMKFIFYNMKAIFEPKHMGGTHGSAIPYIVMGDLSNYEIPLPPLPVQRSIAATLSCLDDKIELNRRINACLEAQAQAVFKSWFVNFEPFRGGEFAESELGRIPKGWRVGRLGEVAKITMGQSPDGSSYNETGNGTVFYQGRAEFGWRFPTNRLYTTQPKRMAKKDAVLLSVRAPIGDINVANEDCCIGRGLAAINSIYKSFTLYTAMTLKNTFEMYNGEGTVFGCINKDALHNIKVIIPPEIIIAQFEYLCSTLDKQIFINEQQSRTLAAIRDALLPRLMTGEIKIGEAGEYTDKLPISRGSV